MAKSEYAIPQGSKVLVTGANGYIASHVVDKLLELGYLVRGSVRTPKPWLDALFEKRHGEGKYETVLLPDLKDESALEQAAEGVAGIIHIVSHTGEGNWSHFLTLWKAADLSLNPDPNALIPTAIETTRVILNAAAKHPDIKRFVLTSSSTAALIPRPNEEGVIVTSDTWNDAAVAAAWSESTPADSKAYVVYAASKTEAEREAWKWVKENNHPFVLNTVLPNINFGKILAPEIGGSTMGYTRNLLKGDSMVTGILPPQWYVDVEDTARLHVIALLDPSVKLERIFAFAAPQNWTDVIAIFRKLRPDNKIIPDPPVNEGRDLSDIVPSKRAEELIKSFFGRPGWTSLEESLADGISDFY